MVETVKMNRTKQDEREEAARLLRRFADDCRLQASQKREPFPDFYRGGANQADYDARQILSVKMGRFE